MALPPNLFVLILAILYFIIWLCVLYNALKRTDFEPINKFMWVFVICSVPLFGMIFYWKPATPPGKRDITVSDVERWKKQ
ncbi:MAG: PLDc N-terminal domain-containing protein [Verrucomicrobiales bacterium]|nr:PLDc N-terminal domain-containing protein [Verrucomicrobiales bacterium]